MEDFAASYAAGETPIPCVRCNQRVKFRDLMATARDLGAAALATGHYARRVKGAAGPELHRARDGDRDQSYFLFATSAEQLKSKAGSIKPGLERIRLAWTGYLDYTVAHAAVHGWCRRARHRFPALQAELRRRNHGVLLMIQIEFSSLGVTNPMECARLAVGMVLETAKMEIEARAKNEAMRGLLWSALELFART